MQEERRLEDEESVNEEPEEEEEASPKGKKVKYKEYMKVVEALEKAKADAAHWKNEYYRAYADMQNLRKSLEEESRSAIRYRAEGFLSSLLPALDAFHLALENPAPTKEAQAYQIGFTYIYNQIVSALVDEGLKEITPKLGDDYDLNTMQAVDAIEDEEAKPNTILKVYAKGYMLHDRLIRPAMVAVAKPKKQEEPAPEPEPTEESPEQEEHQSNEA